MTRTLLGVIACVSLSTSACFAMDFATLEKAQNLGNILGSESFCGFAFDQSAISAWIDDNIPADAMSFAGDLQGATAMTQLTTASMSQSTKTAHCRAVERTAKHHGFLK